MRGSDNMESALSTGSQLLQLVSRLERAWQATPQGLPPPDLSAFLPHPSDLLRPQALHELLRADLEMRWRRQLPTLLESYLEHFPELGGIASLPAELIYHEFRVRRKYGDRPALGDYRGRFPGQYRNLLLLARAEATSVAGGSSTRSASASPTAQMPALSTPADPSIAEVETSGLDWATCSPAADSGKRGGEIVLPATDPPPGQGTTVVPMVGGYRLLDRLGSGALGEVWKAEAPGGVEVAVKRLSRTLEAHEAQYELQSLEHVKKLRHNYLAQIHAYWVHNGRLFVAMELADESLEDRKKKLGAPGQKGIPTDELLRYLSEAAEALDYLHSEGVHHRDIKPANILLLKGHVKVADFGLARPLSGEQSLVNATFCGTPAYMAPEVWENKFSTHSDQWSLAVTYLELRLNRRVFKSRTIPLLMSEIRSGQMDLSPLDKAERRVVRQAVHRDPSQRFPSCTAFVRALETALKPPPPAPLRRRRLPILVALFACLVAGIFLASLSFKFWDHPADPVAGPARVQQAARPGEVLADTGRAVSFRIPLRREGYDGPIQFIPEEDVPVQAEAREGEDFATVSVHVRQRARPGTRTVHLRPADETVEGTISFELTVLYLPPEFEGDVAEVEKGTDGVKSYKRIWRKLGEKERIEFVLVPRERAGEELLSGAPDLSTFYIGRDKVTRGQFRYFAAEDPKKVTDKRWQQHASDDDRMPVRDVTVTDADAFARWLGGRLPSPEEWEKAAGCHHPSRWRDPYWEGPYKGRWKDKPLVAVGRPKPLPVGEASNDESIYHCRDMAGNGSEWTCLTHGRKKVPLPNPLGTLEENVLLRGWDFRAEIPATFEELSKNDREEEYKGTSADLGFRVVLEPNH